MSDREKQKPPLKLLRDSYSDRKERTLGFVSFAIRVDEQGVSAIMVDEDGNPGTPFGPSFMTHSPLVIVCGRGDTASEAIANACNEYPWCYDFDDTEPFGTPYPIGNWMM